ncbi:phage tail protein [Spirosoma sp. KUDC1026]|uniref:phage tail protein n=1 Tax=Spirosoma sp. KUDC1026 TaxID=2745947 RepID=UPI00159BA5A5|nr:tail fiber protein [Spirosoma sp. KUDC1026]QKZ13567.1 phage tail protein [Spirosoma sp. KUDC1026]
MDEYIGIVKLFAGNFAPRGWMFCQGQLLSIAQYNALFAILGTTYGGNGQTTFALPDLRSRVPVGAGYGPGLPPVVSGQMAGSASVTMTTAQLPMHSHPQMVSMQYGSGLPNNTQVLAVPEGTTSEGGSVSVQAYGPVSNLTTLAPSSIGTIGGNQPLDIMPPYTGMNYIICLEGIFPPRD